MAGGDELTDDAIAGDYRIWQRKRGHRYSLDDVVTAWEAVQAVPEARHVLDLGCGIGSVLLMVAWKIPGARIAGIEAQPVSFELAARNVERNGLGARVRLLSGDLRETGVLEDATADGPFDLVTGTPPYFPPGSATLSPDPQRAHARVELRGGVEDYLRAGTRALSERGRIVVCADARKPDRVLTTAAELSLAPVRRRDVVPRAGHKGALFTVWTLAPASAPGAADPEHAPDFIARDTGGRRTGTYRAARTFFALPTDPAEAPSS